MPRFSFRLGLDPMPDWFMDAVSRNDVTLHNVDGRYRGGPDYAEIHRPEDRKNRALFGEWITPSFAVKP